VYNVIVAVCVGMVIYTCFMIICCREFIAWRLFIFSSLRPVLLLFLPFCPSSYDRTISYEVTNGEDSISEYIQERISKRLNNPDF
jgi:hypothetical protein